MHSLPSLAGLLLLALSGPAGAAPRITSPLLTTTTVSTTSGDVTGFTNDTGTPDVVQFLGVPFAEPPLGSLRFAAPAAYSGSSGSGSSNGSSTAAVTTTLPPSCLQQTTGSNVGADGFVNGFATVGPVSEDCLYLNVYAPAGAAPGDDLPVVIWIYGGAYIIGGSNVPYQIPDHWVERTQSHIVVTLNYRLNIFGFPNAAAQPLNVGLMDQRMAVEWVRDNIKAFGGDASRMILWGQSAGAGSVGQYGYAHYADPVVAGLAADSGTATFLLGDDPTHAMFTSVAATVGCGNLSAKAELACMQGVNATTLLNAASFAGLFIPNADNVTAFSDTAERAQNGQLAAIPLITGSNLDEYTSFGATGISDDGISCPVAQEVANRVASGYTTYRYLYSGNFSNIVPAYEGATHSSELPMVFNTHNTLNGPSTDFEWNVSYVMQDMWLSFASDVGKNPSSGSDVWPVYDPDTNSMASFASGNDTVVFDLISGDFIDSQCS
ncbi:Alpha/Beta hydrolase protein [Xylariaceae sp. FL0804]|nr:Alpha/Beta hydrolase protein [Xylariaceae sp. FL0804]